MQKECGICGKWFETDKSSRKYCDDCTGHSDKNKKEYQRGINQSKRRMREPELIKYSCKICGRTVTRENSRTYDLLYGFCSHKCKDIFRKSILKCRHCGVSLKDMNINPYKRNEHFCSEQCKEEYRQLKRKAQ